MLLNAQHILQDFLGNNLGEFGKVAQVGVDLSVTNIRRIVGGKICQDNSKEIDEYEEVETYHLKGKPLTWMLKKGEIYSLTFEQNIKLDNNHTAFIINRSTISRIGGLIRSSVFDPGFESQIGATLYCFADMEIEFGSRIAQVIIFENEPAEEYKGNYQGNKDLK